METDVEFSIGAVYFRHLYRQVYTAMNVMTQIQTAQAQSDWGTVENIEELSIVGSHSETHAPDAGDTTEGSGSHGTHATTTGDDNEPTGPQRFPMNGTKITGVDVHEPGADRLEATEDARDGGESSHISGCRSHGQDEGPKDTTDTRLQEIIQSGYTVFALCLGSELGLLDLMLDSLPTSAAELAAKANCRERQVREWLQLMVASGVVDCDLTGGTFSLPSPMSKSLATQADSISRMTATLPRVFSSFQRVCQHVSPGHRPEIHPHDCGSHHEDVDVVKYTDFILNKVDDLQQKLVEGVKLGCVTDGTWSLLRYMASRFPQTCFTGLDIRTLHSSSYHAEESYVNIQSDGDVHGPILSAGPSQTEDKMSRLASLLPRKLFNGLSVKKSTKPTTVLEEEIQIVEEDSEDECAQNLLNNKKTAYTSSTGTTTKDTTTNNYHTFTGCHDLKVGQSPNNTMPANANIASPCALHCLKELQGRFQLVVVQDCLYLTSSPAECLAEVLSFMAPGGYMFLFIPYTHTNPYLNQLHPLTRALSQRLHCLSLCQQHDVTWLGLSPGIERLSKLLKHTGFIIENIEWLVETSKVAFMCRKLSDEEG